MASIASRDSVSLSIVAVICWVTTGVNFSTSWISSFAAFSDLSSSSIIFSASAMPCDLPRSHILALLVLILIISTSALALICASIRSTVTYLRVFSTIFSASSPAASCGPATSTTALIDFIELYSAGIANT